MGRQIVQSLPHSFLVSIPGLSHSFDGLNNPGCFDKIALDFFDDPDARPESDCIARMDPPAYQTARK